MAVAARMMRDLGVGSMPICGDDHGLVGMISEADLVRHLSEDQLATFVESVYGRA